jgi:Prokaryotic E2 family E
MTLRRQFDLPEEDTKFLNDYGLPWETIVDGSQWVLIHDFPAPPGSIKRRSQRRSASRPATQ